MGAERSQWQFPANEVGKVIGWSDEASPSNPSASKGLVNKGPFLETANVSDDPDLSVDGDKVPTRDAVKEYVDAARGEPLVILVTGQSNATSRQSFDWEVPPNLFEWNYNFTQDNVGTAFERPDGDIMSLGLGWGLAAALANPTRNVYIINIALSGNVIANWLPGAAEGKRVYDDIVLNVPPALALIGATKIDQLVWWQGESDRAGVLRDVYVSQFNAVIDRFETNDWFEDNTPVAIHGVTSYAISGDQFYGDMSSFLMACANADPQNRQYIDTSAIPASYWVDVPNLHMNGEGYYLAGKLGHETVAGRVEGVRTAPFVYHKESLGYGLGVTLPKNTRFAVSWNTYPGGQFNDSTVRTFRTTGLDGSGNVFGMDAFGGSGNQIQARAARGALNSGTPDGGSSAVLPLQSGDVILNISMNGWDGTTFQAGGGILMRAAEDWTGSQRGTYYRFFVVTPGTTTNQEVLDITSKGIKLALDPATVGTANNTLGYFAEGTYTPVIQGSSSAGVGTYSVQTGNYQRIGKRCFFDASLTWSAHTGTGGMQVSLPFACSTGVFPVKLYMSDITFANTAQGRITTGNQFVQLTTVATGAAAATLSIDTAGNLSVSGHYLVA